MPASRYVLSVGALIWNASGELLLLRRSASCRRFPGYWETPGGKVNAGEEVEPAICREVEEETGLECVLDGVAGATEFALPQLRVVMLYFNAHVDRRAPRLSAEHSEFRWVKPSMLAAMDLTEPFRRLLECGRIQPRAGDVD